MAVSKRSGEVDSREGYTVQTGMMKVGQKKGEQENLYYQLSVHPIPVSDSAEDMLHIMMITSAYDEALLNV